MKKRFKQMLIVLLSILPMIFCVSCIKKEFNGITSATINENGELIVSYSGGTTQNIGKVVGLNGSDASGNTIIVEGEENSVALATAKGLTSSVSIICNFKQTVQNSIGGFFPSFGGNGYTVNEYSSAGSGVIYKINKELGEAFIVTNYHVVYDSNSDSENGISEDISVYLYGSENESQAIKAEYVGGSLYYDLAVLYVSNNDIIKNSSATSVKIKNSDELYVGQTAIAIGNPEGMGIAASSGVVSVDSEYISMTAADDKTSVSFRVVRIDASINSGNSGGGLFNLNGELIGIVNAKIISTDVENIGYAIPSNVVKGIVENIIHYCFKTELETVQRCIVGITVTTNSSYAIYDENTGYTSIVEDVVVYEVSEGSIVEGVLEVGDKLVSITRNNETMQITRQYHIIDFMLNVRAGDSIIIKVERNNQLIEVTLNITENNIMSY